MFALHQPDVGVSPTEQVQACIQDPLKRWVGPPPDASLRFDATTCELCAANERSENGKCVACAPGSVVDPAANTCVACSIDFMTQLQKSQTEPCHYFSTVSFPGDPDPFSCKSVHIVDYTNISTTALEIQAKGCSNPDIQFVVSASNVSDKAACESLEVLVVFEQVFPDGSTAPPVQQKATGQWVDNGQSCPSGQPCIDLPDFCNFVVGKLPIDAAVNTDSVKVTVYSLTLGIIEVNAGLAIIF
jgi:hypothetical protein